MAGSRNWFEAPRCTVLPAELLLLSEPGETWTLAYEAPAYLVSSSGRLYSSIKQRIIRPEHGRNGRLLVRLPRSGRRGVRRTLGRVVLLSFLGLAPKAGMEALHRNGNIRDNYLSNLCWSPRSKRDAGWHRKHERILGLHRAGLGTAEIARRSGCEFGAVKRHLRAADKEPNRPPCKKRTPARTPRGFRIFKETAGVRVCESSLALEGPHVRVYGGRPVSNDMSEPSLHLSVEQAKAVILGLGAFVRKAKAGKLTERINT